jgi:alpha-tubulin suppressor-like RCC1 family protein
MKVKQIAAGGHHSLALLEDGSIVGWGANGSGQCNPPPPNAAFVAVAAGGYHALAGGAQHSLGLKADGTIAAWGFSAQGQCDVPTELSGETCKLCKQVLPDGA